MDKAALRSIMSSRISSSLQDRKEAAAQSKEAGDALMRSPLWQEASAVLLYVSTEREVDTAPLIECALKQNKRAALPRVRGRGAMDFFCIEKGTPLDAQLRLGAFGILEPLDTLPCLDALPSDALVVCPGLAFTPDGWRLGHGGGYYDRYIARMGRGLGVAGICFGFQIAAFIPHDAHDVRMDKVFSPALPPSAPTDKASLDRRSS